jgi:uncharacterized protein (DUF1684 family)
VPSTAHLAVTGRARPGSDRDAEVPTSVCIAGAARPSAVRALLARSITMTALEIERRLRTRRRRADSRARVLSLALWEQRQAGRARHETHLTEAGAARTLFSIR